MSSGSYANSHKKGNSEDKASNFSRPASKRSTSTEQKIQRIINSSKGRPAKALQNNQIDPSNGTNSLLMPPNQKFLKKNGVKKNVSNASQEKQDSSQHLKTPIR